MTPLDEWRAVPPAARILAGEGVVLFDLLRPSITDGAHCHRIRIISLPFADWSESYVEVSEPGGCGCLRVFALTELAHLLLNLTADEEITLPNREVCMGGHPHFPQADGGP